MKAIFHPLARHAWLGGWALATTCLLIGCSGSNQPSAGSDAKPALAQLAVARGKVDIEGGLLNLSIPRDGTLAPARRA